MSNIKNISMNKEINNVKDMTFNVHLKVYGSKQEGEGREGVGREKLGPQVHFVNNFKRKVFCLIIFECRAFYQISQKFLLCSYKF